MWDDYPEPPIDPPEFDEAPERDPDAWKEQRDNQEPNS